MTFDELPGRGPRWLSDTLYKASVKTFWPALKELGDLNHRYHDYKTVTIKMGDSEFTMNTDADRVIHETTKRLWDLSKLPPDFADAPCDYSKVGDIVRRYWPSMKAVDDLLRHPKCRCVCTYEKGNMSKKLPMYFLATMAEALEEVVKVMDSGQGKYPSPDNWRTVDREEHKHALMRHIMAYMKGEQKDKESGLHSLAHAASRALFIAWLDLVGEKKQATAVSAKETSQAVIGTVPDVPAPTGWLHNQLIAKQAEEIETLKKKLNGHLGQAMHVGPDLPFIQPVPPGVDVWSVYCSPPGQSEVFQCVNETGKSFEGSEAQAGHYRRCLANRYPHMDYWIKQNQ